MDVYSFISAQTAGRESFLLHPSAQGIWLLMRGPAEEPSHERKALLPESPAGQPCVRGELFCEPGKFFKGQ